MLKELQTFIFIGRSGCGKGTQVDFLSDFLKKKSDISIFNLESGARFREFITQDNYTSKLSKQIYDTGDLQPSAISISVWMDLFIENLKGEEHLILDGTPRKLEEALILDEALDFYNRIHRNVIYIDISREEAIKRLKSRGRLDDVQDEDIAKRLEWFDEKVIPTIDFLKANGKYKFMTINGEQEREKVFSDILSALSWQS